VNKSNVKASHTHTFSNGALVFHLLASQNCLKGLITSTTDGATKSLPYGGMRTDRRFATPLFLCLSEIFGKWVHDAATAAMLQSKKVLSKATSLRFIVSVDEDSEVHRFVASGVCAYRKCAQKKLSELEKTLEKREKQFCPPKRRQDKRMRQLKSSLRLLEEVAVWWVSIPELHDKSYDTSVILSRDHGELFYVAPQFLDWAKQLMKKIRASIMKGAIAKHGTRSQKQAYKFVIEDHDIESLFKAKAKELEEAKGETYDNVQWIGFGEN
jgi:hypothetical protein